MFTHEQIEAMPERIYKRLRDINTRYLEMLGKRIAEVGEIIPTDVYKLQRIFESGVDIKEIEAALSKANRMNIREIESLFDDVAEESYNFYEPFYAYRKKTFIPYKDNEPLQKHIEALKRTTVGEYKNLTQTTGFLLYDKNGKIPTKFGELKAVPTTLSETYTITLDNAVQAATMGTTDHQSAMRQVIRALADSGIKTVDYASGYSRRLDTSVRQNILWGIKQCNQEIADMVGEEIGADGYEISYHSNPRPNHADMGGQLYAKGPGRTIKGVYYPSIDTVQHLLDEYGCLHFKFSVILGLSNPTYSKKELAKLKANDNKPVVFEGKEITKYEASQKQRTFETAMRHCDDRLTIAKAADNEILILKETERMRQLQNKYHELSTASELPTKWERTVSGLKTSKKTLTKGGSSGIMKMSRKSTVKSTAASGDIISSADVRVFVDSVKRMGFKISETSEFGGFESYKGDLKILSEFIEDLNLIRTEILPKTRVKDIVLKYEDLGNIDDFAVVRGKTIVLNKRVYDDTNLLERLYDEAVEEGFFVKGTTYRSVPYHEFGHIIYKEQPAVLKRAESVVREFSENNKVSFELYLLGNISKYSMTYSKNVYTELLPEILSGTMSGKSETKKLCIELVRRCIE